MKENRMKVAAAQINAALAEVRRAAIEEAGDVIWAQVDAYEKLLDSPEAWAIYMKSKGDRCLKLIETRRKLTNKKNVLITIFTKLSELKWQKQEQKEN